MPILTKKRFAALVAALGALMFWRRRKQKKASEDLGLGFEAAPPPPAPASPASPPPASPPPAPPAAPPSPPPAAPPPTS
jgi:hypothetical protein